MKKKNKFFKRFTKIAIVIGAEVLLFGGCLIMIYARGTGEGNKNETYQENIALETNNTMGGAEKQSSLQAGTNKDKNIASAVEDNSSETEKSVTTSGGIAAAESKTESESASMTETMDESVMEALLDVEPISQLPELPTGCEVTSLTMALNYIGYDIDKGDLSDKYLIKGRAGVNSYEEAFLGDPRSEESYGCFAPVIVKTANKYLKEQNSQKQAYDLTGTDFEKLYDEILKGNPVIVWGSMYIDEDIVETETWIIDGEELRWPGNEHCMVLNGFNKYDDTVTVCDPLRDMEVYDRAAFEEHYEQMFRMAVVIK